MVRLTREERKEVVAWRCVDLGQGFTVGDVASALRMRPTNYLRGILRELAAEGWLHECEFPWPGGLLARSYTATEQLQDVVRAWRQG